MWSAGGRCTSRVINIAKTANKRLQNTMAGASEAFSRAKLGPFLQELPQLRNPFLEDAPLQRYLRRLCSPEVYSAIEPDLRAFGDRLVREIDPLGRECELNPPYVRHFDVTGRRVDELVTCQAWQRMKAISAEEGLIAVGYSPNSYNQYNRLYQMAKLYLYAPSAGLFSCPLAMTDGAAKVIKEMQSKNKPISATVKEAYDRLTTRDPKRFWTSGQWMTEKRGGSDVANGTETVAVPRPDGKYDLYGYKFFSSATDADMTLTLGRTLDADGKSVHGSGGLSMYFVQVRDPATDRLNNIEIVRLKDKLGTRQLPTAELLLDGVKAEKVSDDGRGVAAIADMLNITRIHNTIAAASGMRRVVMMARDYAHKRESFGKKILDHPLHTQTLARLELETRGSVIMMLEAAKLLGLQEYDLATKNESLMLRLLTPLAKLYTAKQAMSVISEGLECFGGLGYMEDSGMPSGLRDAQVLPIWEGTTNILSLDILRILSKHGEDTLHAFRQKIDKKLMLARQNDQLEASAKRVAHAADEILTFVQRNANSWTVMELAARDFAFSLSSTFVGALLLEHAAWNGATTDDVETAIRWVHDRPLIYLHHADYAYTAKTSSADRSMVLDGYESKSGASSKL